MAYNSTDFLLAADISAGGLLIGSTALVEEGMLAAGEVLPVRLRCTYAAMADAVAMATRSRTL